MRVPSIDELAALFDGDPVSIAETSLGQFLSLAQWPEGEVKLTTAVAGRRAIVYLTPAKSRVAVEIYAPDLVASLTFDDVSSIEADLAGHGVRRMIATIGDGRSATTLALGIRPDITVRLDAVG
jgi:hypothetical protein